MSLKAKIEAVIYASEDPVTLALLTGLLGQEAQAEIERRDGAQQRLALDMGAEMDLIDSEEARADLAFENSTFPVPSTGDTAAETNEAGPADTAHRDREQAREERERARRLREYFRALLDELIADYAAESRGLEIREVASGFRLATKPEYHDAVRGFVKLLKPPLKLTLQALETLAVVAYKQPVTGPEIAEIRGVDSSGVLGSLMARKLITTAGRKQVIGRPILYKTTRDFLLRFGLKDVSELPSIEEFEKMATELTEPNREEPNREEPDREQPRNGLQEIAMNEPVHEHLSTAQPQPDGDSAPLSTSADISPTPDGAPVEPPSVRLGGLPPASTVPGTDDDPTEAGTLARQNERDREERTFPETGSKPSLQPK